MNKDSSKSSRKYQCENRKIENTLDIAWEILSKLKEDKLLRVSDELIEKYKQVEELRPKTLLYQFIYKDLLKLGFLRRIKEEFDNITTENNQVFISEFNRKILSIVLTEPVPFLYERIGEKYQHLLIDEFQDTSDIQFYNLRKLFQIFFLFLIIYIPCILF